MIKGPLFELFYKKAHPRERRVFECVARNATNNSYSMSSRTLGHFTGISEISVELAIIGLTKRGALVRNGKKITINPSFAISTNRSKMATGELLERKWENERMASK